MSSIARVRNALTVRYLSTGRKESWTTFFLQAYAYEYDSSRTAMAQPSNVYPCAMVEVAGGVPPSVPQQPSRAPPPGYSEHMMTGGVPAATDPRTLPGYRQSMRAQR